MSLFDKQSRIEKLLSESQIGLWRVEFEEGKNPRLYADEKMLSLLGVSCDMTPEELFVFQRSCVAREDYDVFEEYSNEIFITGRAELVYHYINPENGVRIIRCSGVKEGVQDKCVYLAGTHQDITETVRLEKGRAIEKNLKKENLELRKSQTFTRDFFDKLIKLQVCGIIAYRIPSREIMVVNDTAKVLYGLPADAEFNDEDAKDFSKRVEYDGGEATVTRLKELRKPGDSVSFSMWVTHKNGRKMHIHVNTMIAEIEAGDRIVISSLLDISSLTQIRADNVRLEEQLEIIQSLSKNFEVIYYIDVKKQTYREVNSKREDIHEAIGSNGNIWNMIRVLNSEFVRESHRDRFAEFFDLETLNLKLSDKEWISIQIENYQSEWMELYLISAKRNSEGDCERLIFASHNITETKRKELAYRQALETTTLEAKAASDAKSKFLMTMSHDIRTPMNAIIGFIDLLDKYRADEEQFTTYYKKARRSCDFLLSLINNVLEITRIESGKVTVDEAVSDTSLLFAEIYDVFDEMMSAKNIKFIGEIDLKHRYVFCDDTKLKEIFLNLLSNAYKYTPAGGTVDMMVTELASDREGFALFETVVSDTGIGMSKDFIPKIFDRFSRESSYTDNKIEGTGLGMAIVKSLVELMGGKITLESELGVGTTYTIRLYHKIADESHILKPESSEEINKIFLGKRILLTEDNELNAEIASEILKAKGFEVDRARDGIECVDMLQKAKVDYYDLILMDIQMPNMDGYKATQIIRQMKSRKRSSIPIVAMTANAFEEDRQKAAEAGMNGHLAKPISVPLLVKTLAELLA